MSDQFLHELPAGLLPPPKRPDPPQSLDEDPSVDDRPNSPSTPLSDDEGTGGSGSEPKLKRRKTASRGDKPSLKLPKQLLTDEEKKFNHIESEKRRRENIRLGFDQLVEVTPTLSQGYKSEAVVLQKSVEYIQHLLRQNQDLKLRISQFQNVLRDDGLMNPPS